MRRCMAGIMAAALVVGLVASCAFDLTSQDDQLAVGSLALGESMSRAAVPSTALPAFFPASYTVELTRTGFASISRTFNSGGSPTPQGKIGAIPVGTWSLTVKAWSAENGAGAQVGVSSPITDTVTIAIGETTIKAVTMIPLATGNGTLQAAYSWPTAQATAATLVVKNTAREVVTPASAPVIQLDAGGGKGRASLNTALPAGEYYLEMQLVKSGVAHTHVWHARITGNLVTDYNIDLPEELSVSDPDGPQLLALEVLDDTSVRLDWADSGSALAYLVFRDTTLIAQCAAALRTYTDSGLAEFPVAYTVRALSSDFGLADGQSAEVDAAIIAKEKAGLAITYSGIDTADSVTANLGLPVAGTFGAAITWTSTNIIAINVATSGSGTVTRPDWGSGDVTVTLTAQITKGSATEEKTFALTVKQALPPALGSE